MLIKTSLNYKKDRIKLKESQLNLNYNLNNMIGGKQNSVYFKFKHQENFCNPFKNKKLKLNYLKPSYVKSKKKIKQSENSLNKINKKFQLTKNVEQERKTNRKNSQISLISSNRNIFDSNQSKKKRFQPQQKIFLKPQNILVDKNTNQKPLQKKLKLKLNSMRNCSKLKKHIQSIKKLNSKNKTIEKKLQTSNSQVLTNQLFSGKNSSFQKSKIDTQNRFQKSLKKKKIYQKSVKKLQKSAQTKQKQIISSMKTKKIKEYSKQDYSSLISKLNCKEEINVKNSVIENSNKTNRKTLENFQHQNFHNNYIDSNIKILIQEERIYKANPALIKQNQNELEWKMRCILADWMQQVCSEYFFKRETYHYSICYLDLMFQRRKNFQKEEFQLLGLTCLFLAAKMEEVYTPKLKNMLQAAKNKYSSQQVLKLETQIYKILDYKITPPTLNNWANWAIELWDQFINKKFVGFSDKKPQFKQPTDKSYMIFRQLFQFIDASLLDVLYLQYKNRAVVTSFMYLILGMEFDVFQKNVIARQFYMRSDYLEDYQNQFNDLYNEFLEECFGFCLKDLLPSIQFCSTFVDLDITIDCPEAAKINQEKVLNGQFEEFLAFQTYNEQQRDYMLCRRSRYGNQLKKKFKQNFNKQNSFISKTFT